MVTASLQIQMSNMAEGGPETYRCDDAMMPWLHSEAVCEGIFCVLSFFLKEKQKLENVFYRWYFVTDAFFDKKNYNCIPCIPDVVDSKPPFHVHYSRIVAVAQ